MAGSKPKQNGPARDTRAAIIEAAVAILGETGPAGLTASALTRAVGISKATLFHHFRTVDEIPLVALEHLALQLKAFSAPPKKPSQPAIEALGEATDRLVERQRAFLNAYFVFFAKALFDETLREKLAVCGEQSRAMIAELVRTNLEGAKTARDVDDFVNLIAIMLDGLALHLLIAKDKRPLLRAWSLFAKIIPTKKTPRRRQKT